MLLLLLVFLLRRKTRRKPTSEVLSLPASISEVERALEAPGLVSGTEPSSEIPEPDVHSRVLVAVQGDMPQAARVISEWLAEPGKQQETQLAG